MCRMALVISKGPVSKFETAFKSAWASSNDDGVGIYWRDNPAPKTGPTRHLARFPKSEDLAKVPTTYDRMLIHFRKSTKGEGTHPFSCKDRNQLNSRNWLLVHNGCVQDTEARKELEKTHKFSTDIDSEIFVHIWGEIEETDLLKRAKKFNEKVEALKITGWANLIFYNVVTDEYVGFSDGTLGCVSKKDLFVVASDDAWLDETLAAKRKIRVASVPTNDIVYGRGLELKWEKKVWTIHAAIQTYSSGYYSEVGGTMNGFVEVSDGVWERAVRPKSKRVSYYAADGSPVQWDKKVKAFVNEKNEIIEEDFDKFGSPADHNFEPSDMDMKDENGIPLCDICLMGRAWHNSEDSTDLSVYDKKDDGKDGKVGYSAIVDSDGYCTTLQESRWNHRHPMTRDIQKTTIQCMCGAITSYGDIHAAHEFTPYIATKTNQPTNFCQICGNEREIGNHKETIPTNHYWTPAKIEFIKEEKITYLESSFCGRCGLQKEVHHLSEKSARIVATTTTNTTVQKKQPDTPRKPLVMVYRMKAEGCECRLMMSPPMICQYHWRTGWHEVDANGFLIKRVPAEKAEGAAPN